MLPVIEMFHSVQGEGQRAGHPSFFVRVSGCNLRCVFKDSICDTPYSSFSPEKSQYKDMDDLVKAFNELADQYPNTKDLVVTGGEPLLYKKDLSEFFHKIHENRSYYVTIETNGTIEPLVAAEDGWWEVDLYSVSPKLSTSEDKNLRFLQEEASQRHNKTRKNLDALVKFAELPYMCYTNTQFKFVYSGEECIDEIKNLVEEIKSTYDKKNEGKPWRPVKTEHMLIDVWLMPEGITKEQLNINRLDTINACIENGWKYTDRLHILAWGDKRGV